MDPSWGTCLHKVMEPMQGWMLGAERTVNWRNPRSMLNHEPLVDRMVLNFVWVLVLSLQVSTWPCHVGEIALHYNQFGKSAPRTCFCFTPYWQPLCFSWVNFHSSVKEAEMTISQHMEFEQGRWIDWAFLTPPLWIILQNTMQKSSKIWLDTPEHHIHILG